VVSADRERLIERLGDAVSAYQDANDAFDDAAARLLNVNRTDLRCLGLLIQEIGPTTPGVLAARLGLTAGSVTTMLDRLERQDYVTRVRDPDDRRKVVISPTDRIVARSREIYGPVVVDGQENLARYSDAELTLIVDFLSSSRQLQERHRARVLRS
jgi:DNA-binding MarR family transcriptional regulator